jgi:hypothetical protein
MSTPNTTNALSALSEALQGYLALTEQELPACAVIPEPNLSAADRRLSEALAKMPSAAERQCTIRDVAGGCRPKTITYHIMQHDVAALRLRVERYTAQRARFASKSVEGDMVSLLTLSQERELTFDELMQAAALEAYSATAAYAKILPFKACILNEGVAITPVVDSEFTSPDSPTTYRAGQYVRRLSGEEYGDGAGPYLGLGVILLAIEDGARGECEEQWQEQPEYVDTSGRITLLIAEDSEHGCRWDVQTVERMHRIIADFLFHRILAQWYAICAMPADEQRMALSADSLRADLAIALGSARP